MRKLLIPIIQGPRDWQMHLGESTVQNIQLDYVSMRWVLQWVHAHIQQRLCGV